MIVVMKTAITILMLGINLMAITAIDTEIGVPLPFTCKLEYTQGTWKDPVIMNTTVGDVPYACNGIQLAQGLIDSYRWFPGEDGKWRLFRLDYKFPQLLGGEVRSHLQQVVQKQYYQCLLLFLNRCKDYNADPKKNEAYYVRIDQYGSQNSLVTGTQGDTTLTITGHKTNDQYPTNVPELKVRVETERYKNYNGSMSNYKLSQKYGMTFYSDQLAKDEGCNSTLWLYPRYCCNKKCVAETSYGNVFIVLKGKNNKRILVTLDEKYMIFPGSYRDAAIKLAKKMTDVTFKTNCIDIKQLQKLAAQNKLLEMFTTGNYAQITPIIEVKYNGASIPVPTKTQSDSIYLRIKNYIRNVCFGTSKDEYKWMSCPNPSDPNGISSCSTAP